MKPSPPAERKPEGSPGVRVSFVVLKFVGKAVLNAVSAGILGDLLMDVVPDVAHTVWETWGKSRGERQRKEEIQALAEAPDAEVRRQTRLIAEELTAGRPPEERERLTRLLQDVPGRIRRTLRRPEDPSGRTVPDGLTLRRPEDLIRFLPDRPARFQPGDRPLPGVDWELVELLGAGGYGEVWKAHNPNLHSAPPVALKFCLEPSAAAALRNEAELLDRVMTQGQHPGVVPLRHTYLSADPPCLEYEYVAGGDLAGLILEWGRAGGPAPEQAARVVLRVAEVLAFTHALQPPIVHRDVKPANILVRRSADGATRFLVSDFGIGGLAARETLKKAAAAESDSRGRTAGLNGSYTPLYASPQQAAGGPPDPRDDVYALGVVWYQLLTGDLKQGAPTGVRWMEALARRGMSSRMRRLLASCVEQRPEDRPADAGELASRLAALLAAPPPAAPPAAPALAPPSEAPAPPPQPPARPRSWVVPLLAAVLMLLAAGAGAALLIPFLRNLPPTNPPAPPPTPVASQPLKGEQVFTVNAPACWVAFGPDGRRLLGLGPDRTLRAWDAGSGEEQAPLALAGTDGPPWEAAFSPDGKRLAAVGWRVGVWDAGTGHKAYTLDEHSGMVSHVVFRPDGGGLATVADAPGEPVRSEVKVWEADGGRLVATLGQDGRVTAAALSPDGERLAAGADDGAIRIWNIAEQRLERTLPGDGGAVTAVAYDRDGGRLASAAGRKEDGTVTVWDARIGDVVRKLTGHTDRVTAVAFSPDGRGLASGSADRTVRLWDVDAGETEHTLSGHAYPVLSVVYNARGDRLATVAGRREGDDFTGELRVWK